MTALVVHCALMGRRLIRSKQAVLLQKIILKPAIGPLLKNILSVVLYSDVSPASTNMNTFKDFFSEVRRRKVLRATVIYAAIAWVAIQVVVAVFPTLGLPQWMTRTLVVILLAGVPVAIILSWIFDFNPDKIKLDSAYSRDEDEGSTHPETAPADKFAAAINIPAPATSSGIVGRMKEISELVEILLFESRIATITGPGGTGKTRLAIEVAGELCNDFPGGFAFLQLAPITDPAGVIPAIARALEVHEAEARSDVDGIATLIGERHVLFVLDNFEQVVDAAPEVSALLSKAPNLKVLVTSRAPLRIAGEREYNLQPLAVPATDLSLDEMSAVSSVKLFVDRAATARSDFELSAANADAVAKLCDRLDGLPLALELAAARIRVLEPDDLLGRLDQALDVLTVGARDLPERQQTLRATIDWSHSLLDENEQTLFRRLAVFAGGYTHDAVESVCYEDDTRHRELDELTSLVEKGLVYQNNGRFDMLQTIRDFSIEKLAESGEEIEIRSRHADYFCDFADKIDRGIRCTEQLNSMERGDIEYANLTEAFKFFERMTVSHDVPDSASTIPNADAIQKGMAMSGALWLFWHIRGQHAVARDKAGLFLEADSDATPTVARSRALKSYALGIFTLGQVEDSLKYYAESIETAEAIDSKVDIADARMAYGLTWMVAGDLEKARASLEEAVSVSRSIGEEMVLGLSLYFHGVMEMASGNLDAASVSLDEALSIQQRIQDFEGMGGSLSGMGAVAAARGDHSRSVEVYRESIEAFGKVGDRPEQARVLGEIAWQYLALKDVDQARQGFLASLQAYDEVGSVRGKGITLFGLAATEMVEGNPERALTIAAAAERFSAEEGVVVEVTDGTPGKEYIEAAKKQLSEDEVASLSDKGAAMTVDEAVRFVLHAQILADG